MTPQAAFLSLPFYEQANRGKTGLQVIAACALLGPLITMLIWIGKDRWEVALPFGLGAGMLVLYWWYTTLSAIADNCTTVSLRTVPNLKRRAAVTVISIWLLSSALIASSIAEPAIFILICWSSAACLASRSHRLARFALLLAVLWIVVSPCWEYLHHFRPNGNLGRNVLFLVSVMATVASFFAFIGISTVFPFLSALLCVAWLSLIYLPEKLSGVPFGTLIGRIELWLTHPLMYWSIAAILFSILLYGLVGMSPERRSHLQRSHANRFGSIFSGRWRSNADQLAPRGLLLPGYARALASALRRRAPDAQLMTFCMGSSLQWSMVASAALVFAAIGTVLGWKIPASTDVALRIFTTYFGVIILTVVGSSISQFAYRTRREQALLSLTPITIRDGALNQWFGRAIAQQLAIAWLASICVSEWLTWAFDLDWPTLARAAMVASAALPWALALSLRDYARMKPPRALGGMVVALALFNFAIGAAVYLKWPVDWLSGPLLAVGLVCSVWRWRRMMVAPPAWPVGRLADQ